MWKEQLFSPKQVTWELVCSHFRDGTDRLNITGWSRKGNSGFNFAITSVTDFNHLFTVTPRNVWCIKVKLHLPHHLYSVTPLPSKTHTTANIDAIHFRMCNILKSLPKKFSSTYSILAYLFRAMLCDDTMRNVFCFNGFNQTAIVPRYSAHVKSRKTIKTIITRKHYP